MSIGYDTVLKRLREERKRLNWTQEEMSQKLWLTQSHYNKIENGFKRLSYRELQRLNEIGVDVYHILTGKRIENPFSEEYFKNCNDLAATALCQITYAVLSALSRMEKNISETGRRITNTSYILSNRSTGKSLWLLLRDCNNLKQTQMAEIIKIDVKKYRKLEQKLLLPDSEIIFQTCDCFQVSPFLFLDERGFAIKEIYSILCEVDHDTRNALFDYLELGYSKFMI